MERCQLLQVLRRSALRHGRVLTLEQAVGVGATRKVMAGLVRSGTYDRPFPGVYVLAGAASGAAGGHEVAVRAALAALGPAAAASHRSAAWLYGLVARPPAAVQVTVPGGFARRLPGVEVHRCADRLVVTSVRGVRGTDVARTLVDLAAMASPAELSEAVDRALARGLIGLGSLRGEAVQARRGAVALRRCVAELGEIGRPEASALELRLSRVLTRFGLPVPRVEAIAGPEGRYRLDFAYPDRKLAIEVNGYAWHHSPGQAARDQARLRALTLEGWTVLVYTWRDVVFDPERVAGEILAAYQALGARAGGAGLV